jgi:hypothetical protein
VRLVALLFVVAAVGCASSPEARRQAEARRARCAAIELIPVGTVPTRPYQVIRDITADAGARLGNEALREDACRIGADAVINVRANSPTSYAPSGPSAMFDDRAQVSGTAIVYTDAPPSPAAASPTEP